MKAWKMLKKNRMSSVMSYRQTVHYPVGQTVQARITYGNLCGPNQSLLGDNEAFQEQFGELQDRLTPLFTFASLAAIQRFMLTLNGEVRRMSSKQVKEELVPHMTLARCEIEPVTDPLEIQFWTQRFQLQQKTKSWGVFWDDYFKNVRLAKTVTCLE